MPLPATGHENNARRGDRQGPIDLDTSSDDDGGGDDFGPGPRGGRGNQNRRGSGAKVSGTRQIKASTRTVTTGQPPSRAKRKRETDDQSEFQRSRRNSVDLTQGSNSWRRGTFCFDTTVYMWKRGCRAHCYERERQQRKNVLLMLKTPGRELRLFRMG